MLTAKRFMIGGPFIAAGWFIVATEQLESAANALVKGVDTRRKEVIDRF